jgi:membrane-bound ClpP family serine protease
MHECISSFHPLSIKKRIGTIPEKKLSGGTVVAGVIVFFLGVIGLLQLYQRTILPVDLAIVGAYLTTLGALVLFGVIALVGIGLMVGGLVTLGEPQEKTVVETPMVQPTVIVTQPLDSATVRGYGYVALSDLELTILRYISQGKTSAEIATLTGVSEVKVKEKFAKLRVGGYLTDKDELSEKGLEVLRVANATRVQVQAPP